MIETRDLTRRFGAATAVESLTLSVARGEVFAFLGPNGAGKTTTVRMLACLIAPTSGEAIVAGRRVGADNDGIRAHIGILTEAPGLYERLSAAQNLAFFAQLHSLPGDRSDAQVRRYLAMLGLWERRNEPVAAFSKGMKQKLAIARALLHEPEVLFLDEPTSALDPESAKVVRDFIAELRGEGRTIFLCTHNLDEAERLADHIGVMKQRLIQVGTPEGLRRSLYGRHVVVRLRDASGAPIDALRALPGANTVNVEGSQIVIGVDNPDEMTPAIVRAVVQAGGDVLSVVEEKHSLEDVYLNLVHHEAEARP
ncbi:MAG: ABC transporter ATP-binding protein [Chloroflexi bacterium]|nr:ABC transporter ATP-binding protein [Chloroflexota bacterium]